ncbi:MAG: protein phosphatase 2C domain-containing protein [Terracidiphilus sp.]|jgi:protein phosphatase
MSSLAIHPQPDILFAEECERPANREESPVSVLHVRLALGDLLLVADGGTSSPECSFASRLVAEHFYAHLSALPPDYPAENAIREAAERANAGILAVSSAPGSSLRGARSTVVAALLQQDGEITHARIAHIGDSRAYLLRAGRLHQLTTDHTMVQEMLDRKMISTFEAQHHPEAAVLTRSLGQRLAVEIEIEQVPLAVGDTLLLCSGGLWRRVPELEIQAAADSATADSAGRNLLSLALAAGGKDGVGIEIARIILPPAARQRHSEHPPIALGLVLTVFLLAVAGVVALIWYLI